MADTYTNANAAPANTTEATLYTAPSSAGNVAIVDPIRIANKTSSDATITLKRRSNAGSTDYYLLYQILVKKNSVLQLGRVVLKAGDSLKYTAGTGNALDITAEILERT